MGIIVKIVLIAVIGALFLAADTRKVGDGFTLGGVSYVVEEIDTIAGVQSYICSYVDSDGIIKHQIIPVSSVV